MAFAAAGAPSDPVFSVPLNPPAAADIAACRARAVVACTGADAAFGGGGGGGATAGAAIFGPNPMACPWLRGGELCAELIAFKGPNLLDGVLPSNLATKFSVEVLGARTCRLAHDGEAVFHHQDTDG